MTFTVDTLIQRARSMPIERELRYRSVTLHGRGINRAGPCPRCGGVDRFGVNLKKQIWNCRGCSVGGDIIALVRHLDGVGFVAACKVLVGEHPRTGATEPAPVPDHPADSYEREQHRKAAWLWSQRQPIAGTLAERYLRQVRGITCPLPPTLGYLPPSAKYPHPTMIAAFALAYETEPEVLAPPRQVAAVHLTKLRPDGRGKADDIEMPKRFLGSPGALPIVLAPPRDLLGLAITEGIEDALSAHQATGLGAWAAGASGCMPPLAETLPRYIEAVTIYAHPDPSGRKNATALADALVDRDVREVLVEGLA
jgi:putative DNA primase/helicase